MQSATPSIQHETSKEPSTKGEVVKNKFSHDIRGEYRTTRARHLVDDVILMLHTHTYTHTRSQSDAQHKVCSKNNF
jgi:hypothetical protein